MVCSLSLLLSSLFSSIPMSDDETVAVVIVGEKRGDRDRMRRQEVGWMESWVVGEMGWAGATYPPSSSLSIYLYLLSILPSFLPLCHLHTYLATACLATHIHIFPFCTHLAFALPYCHLPPHTCSLLCLPCLILYFYCIACHCHFACACCLLTHAFFCLFVHAGFVYICTYLPLYLLFAHLYCGMGSYALSSVLHYMCIFLYVFLLIYYMYLYPFLCAATVLLALLLVLCLPCPCLPPHHHLLTCTPPHPSLLPLPAPPPRPCPPSPHNPTTHPTTTFPLPPPTTTHTPVLPSSLPFTTPILPLLPQSPPHLLLPCHPCLPYTYLPSLILFFNKHFYVCFCVYIFFPHIFFFFFHNQAAILPHCLPFLSFLLLNSVPPYSCLLHTHLSQFENGIGEMNRQWVRHCVVVHAHTTCLFLMCCALMFGVWCVVTGLWDMMQFLPLPVQHAFLCLAFGTPSSSIHPLHLSLSLKARRRWRMTGIFTPPRNFPHRHSTPHPHAATLCWTLTGGGLVYSLPYSPFPLTPCPTTAPLFLHTLFQGEDDRSLSPSFFFPSIIISFLLKMPLTVTVGWSSFLFPCLLLSVPPLPACLHTPFS